MSRINARTGGKAAAALMALSIAFIGAKEGRRLKAYKDSVGVWTICDGETQGVFPGMQLTKAQCDAMFARRLDSPFATKMEACVPDAKDEKRMGPHTYVSFLSIAYNIGSYGFCKSSMARLWNAGEHKRACQQIARYVYGRGQVYLRGLANRRRDEMAWCLKEA